MDKIQEFKLYTQLHEQEYILPKNSQVLSARFSNISDMIIVDILVDFDSDETINKNFLVFDNESIIDDNMKADYIGTAVNTKEDKAYYIFEKIR